MAGALLFWGWQTGLWFWGLLMAAVIELAHFTRARWELTDADLNRISDLCWLLILGTGLLLYSTVDRLVFIFKFVQWLPLTLFPIILAQAYGNREAMPLSVFAWLLRRAPQSPAARKSFNISFAYFAVCLAGASASTRRVGGFYLGVSLLILLALFSVRPRRIGWPMWIVLAAAVAEAGQASHWQLRRAQDRLESALTGWLADYLRQPTDSGECRTLIGHAGPIQLSGAIALRVHVPPGESPPSLLREATYDNYKNQTWWATSNEYFSVNTSVSNDTVFRLLPPKKVSTTVQIARYFRNGDGTLALPHGTFEVDDLPALVHTNRMGVAMIDSGPGLVNLTARYGAGASLDAPTNGLDLWVPENERPALEQVADELHLDAMSERQKIRAVSGFFRDHFQYSLRGDQGTGKTPLARFLTETRSGHCEYFATATVLLLREAGVCARYVTGYAVLGSARRGDTYLVRERHAHAWALVFHGDAGTWEQIDNTPSSWEQSEENQPPWWEAASDMFSNLYFEFSKWRWSKTSFAYYADWLMAPLIVYLVWRILSSGRRHQPEGGGRADAAPPVWPGLDSELYLINRRLSEVHLSRQAGEPLALWQERLERAFPASPALRRIFHLHRRLRFDPRGLESHDRALLKREAEAWLAEYEAQSRQGRAPASSRDELTT
jgi:transglutaminase-like putative cysteine protease